jgi:Fe-S-cluster containining protein
MSETPADPFVKNLHQARFECIFGRGCDGICCREGEPPIYRDEIERIHANLSKILPELRPEARATLQSAGFLSDEIKAQQRVLRVVDGWCIFFNGGCALHRLGVNEGDKYRYKPAACSLFPLDKNDQDEWYVRQKNYDGEIWDLFCLDPTQTTVPAVESLREEIALAKKLDEEAPPPTATRED